MGCVCSAGRGGGADGDDYGDNNHGDDHHGDKTNDDNQQKVNHQMVGEGTPTRSMLTVNPNDAAMQIRPAQVSGRAIAGRATSASSQRNANSIGSFLSHLLQHKKRQKTVRVEAEWTQEEKENRRGSCERTERHQNGQVVGATSGPTCTSSIRREPKGEHKFSKMQASNSSSDQPEQQDNPAASASNEQSLVDHRDARRQEHAGDTEEAHLFVSVQQLCFEIIQERLLASLAGPKVLCLFVFGCQGSSKGELAFELAEHSPLVGLFKPDGQAHQVDHLEACCPLFHYVDVSALIVANIDDRIAEYHQLVAQTTRTKRAQTPTEGDEEPEQEDEQEESAEGEPRRAHEPSLKSQLSNASESCKPSEPNDTFGGLVTLTTKQRSILQLKLIKYSNCLTSKWISSLIEKEVRKLEDKLRELNDTKLPARVYLVNLVPSQLTLFKSCLYLEQNLALRDFGYPFYAIKFERRLNIKLLTKERAASELSSGQGDSQQANHHTRRLQLVNSSRFPLIKLPHLTSSVAANKAGPSTSHELQEANHHQTSLETANILANNVNEKLGPKHQENFARQFGHLKKLLCLRYNPTKNYNYFQDEPSQMDRTGEDENNNLEDHQQDEHKPSQSTYCSRLFRADRQSRLGVRAASALSESSREVQLINHPTGKVTGCGLHPQDDGGHLRAGPIDSPSASPSPTASLLSNQTSLVSCASVELLGDQIGSRVHLMGWTARLAIELELFDSTRSSSSHRWRLSPSPGGQTATAGCHLSDRTAGDQRDEQQAQEQPAPPPPSNKCLHVFHPPRSALAGIRSPLSFASQASPTPTTPANQYELISCLVEYPNGRHQSVLEVKRAPGKGRSSSSSGSFKLKTRGDLNKLAKLIESSRRQLRRDLDLWLAAAITDLCKEQPGHQPSHQLPGHRRHSSATNHLHSMHQQQLAGQASSSSWPPPPSLVVNSIRVDISRLAKILGDRPQEQHQQQQAAPEEVSPLPAPVRLPTLMVNDDQIDGRPCKASSLRSHRNSGRRHVQFKLSQAPGGGGGGGSGDCLGGQPGVRAQRRLWLDSRQCENLFISCEEAALFGQLDLFASLLCQSGLIVGTNSEATS